MKSGRDTLATIERTLRAVRDETDRAGSELKSTAEDLAANRHAQAEATRRLAMLRLGKLESGALVEYLDSADRQAQEAIAERDQAFVALEEKIVAARRRLEDPEAERETVHAEVDAAAQALAELEARVQQSLTEDTAYQTQLQRCRAAAGTAEAAQEKFQQAEADRLDKGKPFEADRLFIYLWKRHYGTPDYSAGPLIRTLDGWVANLIGYTRARPNYWMLLEIPKRLQEHADRLRDASDTAIDVLGELETTAAVAAGIPGLQEQLATTESRQDEVDQHIEQAEDALRDLNEQRMAFSSGEDLYIQRGLAILAEALHRKDVRELRARARATFERDDDQLVSELIDLRDQDEALTQELASHRRTQADQISRLKELEEVRRRFKRKRFDDLRSGFRNDNIIGAMLGQFLRGLVGSAELWRVIERQQRHVDIGAWPDFGSGGLRRRNTRQNSPWHWPGNRRGGGGSSWRLPRGGGSSSRGGSFGRRGGLGGRRGGGGGFKTGGGF